MTTLIRALVFALLGANLAAANGQEPSLEPADNAIKFNLIQINDVYEITPVGKEGGMAKLATVFNAYKQVNPNTFLLIAGDFFSPSALGTARVDGERLAGKQMVALLNAIPLYLATFGNHEFDVSEAQFLQRLDESKFGWVSSNVIAADGRAFQKVEPNRIQIIESGGQRVRVGYFGVTIPSNPAKYVKYTDFMDEAVKQVRELRPKVDVLIALTHLAYADDMRLALAFPDIDMIIGGHEHEKHRIEIASLPGIYKADANARSVFVHEFAFDPITRKLRKNSTLRPLGADIPEDPTVRSEVEKWVKIAFDGFRKDGFNPEAKVADVSMALDGRESSVRNGPTELTKIIADGMLAVAPGSEIAIYNSGSIRIDDMIQPGEVTEYDVIRILPFGGKIVSIRVKGAFLKRVLSQGIANKGQGGYLQTAGVTYNGDQPMHNGEAIDDSRVYTIAINDFLLTGNEQNFSWLKRDGNPEITVMMEHQDIRNATIAELKRRFGQPKPRPEVAAFPTLAAVR
jgi:5'-nucleotidase